MVPPPILDDLRLVEDRGPGVGECVQISLSVPPPLGLVVFLAVMGAPRVVVRSVFLADMGAPRVVVRVMVVGSGVGVMVAGPGPVVVRLSGRVVRRVVVGSSVVVENGSYVLSVVADVVVACQQNIFACRIH